MNEKLKDEKDVNFGTKGVKPMLWVVVVSLIVILVGLIWW